jgi:ABC-type multidrug transport system ATPase subunit
VEALCDRVTIIRSGRAAETGTFQELRHLTRTSVVVDAVQPIGPVTGAPECTTRGCRTATGMP